MTKVLTMNEKDTLSTAEAVLDLSRIIRRTKPDLGALQEWNGVRDKATQQLLDALGYGYDRGPHGGGPVLWNTADGYALHSIKSRRLSLPEFVGNLPGRRSRLGSSWATEAVLTKGLLRQRTVLISAHLTAEVEDAVHGGYKTDLGHKLRVMRHKREKRRLGRRARQWVKRGALVYVVGDTNYNRMSLGGFTSCWDNRTGGSLGWRAVDIVYSDKPASEVRTYSTHSDHDAVVATY